jgi:NAD(P)-dependent dehydrogenase (short-subunit alcohol dehydrogenase family)
VELSNQVVLVSGAGRNLGRVIALGAADRGAAVGVMVRSDVAGAHEVAEAIVGSGGQAIPLVGDVRDAAAVSAAVAACEAHLGPVTSVVHAAAQRSHEPIVDLSYRQWRETIDVTLAGAYHLTTSTIAGMRSRGFGRLVFIGGASTVHGLPRGCAHTAAAKSALRGLVRSLAQEAGRSGITANVVAPGTIASPSRAGVWPVFDGWSPVDASVLGRPVEQAEVVSAVLYLLDPIAQPVTGQVIHVDGGLFGFDG